MKSVIIITLISITFSSIENLSSSLITETPLSKKEQAFQILQTKCNVCHEKKNKRRVFTLENMDQNKKRIYRQVFKWKRMPKGNEIELTPKESAQLKEWILSKNKK